MAQIKWILTNCYVALFGRRTNYDILILNYHSITASQVSTEWSVTGDMFEKQMRYLHEQRIETITLGELLTMKQDHIVKKNQLNK